MAEADGRVYIDTEIQTDGFTAGSKEIEEASKRMIKTVGRIGETAKISLQKQANAFVKQNQLLSQQKSKVGALEQEYTRLSETRIETDEFKEIGKQIDTDTAKLNRLEKTQEEFLATGGKQKSSAYQRRQMQIEELRNSIRYAKGEQQELLNSGGAYKVSDTSDIQRKLAIETEKLWQMNDTLGTSYHALKQKVISYGGQVKNLTGIKGRLIVAFEKVRNSIRRTNSAMAGLDGNTKRTRMSLGRMMRTSLLMGIAFRAFSAVMEGVKTGMNNLAQYSDDTNADLSSLMSSLTQLKNSFATAFAPILSIVTPTLTKFMNVLAKAITYVGMFFSVLSGKDTYLRAVEVQEDYAAGLKDTASSAKDAEKALKGYLNPIDEINKLESNDLSSADSGVSGITPDQMFEEVKIENVEGLKPIFDDILDTVIAIGAGILAWKVSSAFTNDLKTLLGIASIASGITLLIENIDAVMSGDYKNVSMESAIKTAISGLLVGAGLVLVGASLWAIPIALALSFTITDVAVNWKNIKTSVSSTFEAIVGIFQGDWSGAFDKIQESLLASFTADSWVNEAAKTIADGIFGESTWDKCVKTLQDNEHYLKNLGKMVVLKIALGIYEQLTTLKTNIISTFNSLKQSVSDIWNKIYSAVKGPVNSIIGAINGMVSGVVSGMNSVIKALNKLNIKIPDWLKYVPGASKFAGKSFGFNISTMTAPKIPYLATGAVIPPNSPFVAMLGDQKRGTNIETPEKLLRQIIREELGNKQSGNVTYRFTGQINRRVLFEEVITEAKIRQGQNGRNPFELA